MSTAKEESDNFVSEDQVDNTSKEYASVHMVLDQPLLLELILDYAIRQNHGIPCASIVCFSCNQYKYTNIRSLRLVQKTWKVAVCKLLRKNFQPVYNVTLHQHNSQNERPYVQKHGKTLDRFANFLRSINKNGNTATTFGLSIRPGFFRLENYDSFYSFLLRFGKDLLKLEMFLPANGVTLPGAFPNLVLPSLKSLKVKFTGNAAENPEPAENLYFQYDTNIILLLQSLLNGNKSLINFECKSNILFDNGMPIGLQFLSLPSSVTKIAITCNSNGKELELLLRNNLPKLSILKLYIDSDTPGFRISQVLEKFQTNLRKLLLYTLPFNPIDNQLQLSFPVMPNLKLFAVVNLNPTLEISPSPFFNCFPKLQELHLQHPMPLMKTLVPTGPWLSIKVLCLAVNNIDLELETDLLKSIFKNMRQLKQLVVRVVNTQAFTNSDHWDSLLTGVPMQFIPILHDFPNIWSKLYLNDDKASSLRMLSELERLELETGNWMNLDRDVGDPLISNLTFYLALLKMPKLSELKFRRRFSVSNQMIEEWNNKGGKITYSSN